MTTPTLSDLELDPARLVAVIETQNALIAAGLDSEAIMRIVEERAAALTGADAAAVVLAGGDETDRDAGRAAGAVSTVSVPLRHRDRVIGVLEVHADRTLAFDDTDVRLLGFLSGLIGSVLARAAELDGTASGIRQDALTGLGDRRAYDERLHREVARADRYGRPLALVVLELDGVDRVEDLHGHPAADRALLGAAGALRRLRAADECFRIGGGAFAVLLPDTHPAGARTVADRLAAAIDRAELGAGAVGATYGIGHFLGQTAEELQEGADADLAAARRRRRGRDGRAA